MRKKINLAYTLSLRSQCAHWLWQSVPPLIFPLLRSPVMSFLTHQNNDLLWLSSSLLDGAPVRHGFSTR